MPPREILPRRQRIIGSRTMTEATTIQAPAVSGTVSKHSPLAFAVA